jgi:hypothetical protein
MSCYEWEDGSIKIPSGSWKGLKKTVRDTWNEEQENKLRDALRIYEKLIAKGKGKRNFDYRAALNSESGSWKISHSLFPYNDRERKKPLKPKKKDFPTVGNNHTEFNFDGEATISFNNKTKTVHWSVSENNHAIESARSHPVGTAFFRALSRITWTSKTGGVLSGNDEYNRDENRDYGGGGNYITQTFGGIGDRAHKAKHGWV